MYTKYARLRDERGVTDYRVATDLGISRTAFSEWKAGKYEPKLEKVALLAEYFGVPIEYFVKKEGE